MSSENNAVLQNATVYPNPTEEQKKEIISKLQLKPFVNEGGAPVNRITIRPENSENFQFLDNPEVYYSQSNNSFVIFGKFEDSSVPQDVDGLRAKEEKTTVTKDPSEIHDDLAVQADAPKMTREERIASYTNTDNVVVDDAYLQEYGNGLTQKQIDIVAKQTGCQDRYMIFNVLMEKKQDLINSIMTVKDLMQ
ncbi:uncharacterized protein HGUI_02676 [Hanseniaspora guilliermondii]|uniref:Nascent polypeptide-associated complex subunit beta n=1 Tax=Hanseniaspora guilliermondii TaxID=56406 RepID=A0A1L0B3U7_9ASCO|nr:uncharacterized protein HGUI_02676 [Hanseniaspora guilliermondii]